MVKPKSRWWSWYTARGKVRAECRAGNGKTMHLSPLYSTKQSAIAWAKKHGAPVGLLSRAVPGERVEQWV